MVTRLLHWIRKALRALFYPEWLKPRQNTRSSSDTTAATLPQPVSKEAQVIPVSPSSAPSRGEERNSQTNVPEPRKRQWREKTVTVLGTDIQTGEQVTISLEEQRLGQYVIGSTGTGKTTLLDNMIHSVASQSHGFCLIEPHGSLVRSVISSLPPDLLKKVILIDLADSGELPVGINLFSCPQPRTIKTIAAVSSFVSHVFEKVWGAGTETPRLMMVLRAITRTLIENSPDATFTEIPLLLSHEGIRQLMVKNLTNSSIASFWESYNHRSQRDRDELTASTLNKVVSFLDQDLIRNIVGQSKTTLNFRQIMDEGKILLVSLSPQFEEASRLIGSVLIGQILMAAFSRSDTPEEERRPFFLFCDEYQRFATSDFATLLAEARKFKIITILANQTLTQLDEMNQAAALQAGNLLSFRVNGEDSKVVARSFDATPTPELVGEEPIRSPVADVLIYLVLRGHTNERVTRFAQTYLTALEKYIGTSVRERHAATHECFHGALVLSDLEVQRGRKLLNDALYAAMSERRSDIAIAPLGLYILTTAQGNTMEYAFSDYLHTEPIDLFGAHKLRDCTRMAAFGKPDFLTDGAARFVSDQPKKYRWMAERIASMLTDLRYVLSVLSEHPILVDTGQYVPQYRQRTYQDQENLIANELSTLPRYTARVRLISGREHTIHTLPAPKMQSEQEIDERIASIKQRMLFFGICKPYAKVQAEIDLRQARWHQRAEADIPPPPPLHTNGRRRNSRQKPPERPKDDQ
jgi:type IV secretion system coupling TraD/TrwB family protein